MIVDINDNEWIVRFRGKKVTFRAYPAFNRMTEKIKNYGDAIIQFEFAGIQEIDPSALGMFLQFFHTLDPDHHKIKILNASAEIQKKLDDLFSVIDSKNYYKAVVSTSQESPNQLFAKVLYARSSKIRHSNNTEDKKRTKSADSQTQNSEQHKKTMVSYLHLNKNKPPITPNSDSN